MRGPLVIGEPAVAVAPALAAAEPYRPDTIIDGGFALGLTVRAASVRGLAKRWVGGPRQDDICIATHEPSHTLLIAVADGVSGASRSDIAAALAVRQAVAAIARQLDDGDELDWKEVFEQAAWALLEEHRRSSGDRQATVEQAAPALSTTLLLALVGEPAGGVARVRLAAVGDSPAFVLKEGSFRALLAAEEPADGLIANTVHALPRAVRAVRSDQCELDHGSVLLLCTDGLALPLADGSGEVGAVFARELARPPEIANFARLVDFSRSTYDDDRSLVAVWPRGVAG